MIRTWCLLICLAQTVCLAQDQWKDVYKESAWSDRDRWQRANELIQFLNLKPGSSVADIGCHEGYMSFKLSKIVGEQGRVYAVDVKQDKLNNLQLIATERKVSNIITIKGDYDNPKLTSNTLDGVIIIDAFHEMDYHDQILRHIKSALKVGGRLLLCEPISDARRDSSRDEQERRHELGMEYALKDLEKAGFKILEKHESFVDRSKEKGDKMWIIVAVR